jgi:flagellar biosynthesis/type III secretory pathway protein FliH
MARVIKGESAASDEAAKAAVLTLRDITEETRQIVLEARKEAARIIADARAATEAVLRQAEERGFAEGFARGRNDGYADGRQQAHDEWEQKLSRQSAELAAAARKVIDELSAARAGVLNQARSQMLEFALVLAERIVGRVAVADIEAAKANLEKSLKLAPSGGQITVLVNPGQLHLLRLRCGELAAGLSGEGGVMLVSDETVSPGGVRVRVGSGEIDATIETQLAKVAETLLGSRGAECFRLGTYEPVGEVPARESELESA